MSHLRKVALFIALDLAVLLFVLLLLTYYGMSHLLLLSMGLVFLVMTIYDLRSGNFSKIFSEFLGLSDYDEIGRLRWLPVVLSALLLIISMPVLLEHGLVNNIQRQAMQHGQFIRVAFPAIAGGIVVIVIAIWTIFTGSRNK
ncbi:MAG: hypothetical protein MUP57_00055 [Clostridia bacterium]|nr:hypothetical protein [Clostridia bacterium]